MSNLEKAAEIVYNYGQTTFEKSLFVARALSAEGVLAPDLPAPTYEHVPVWESGDLEVQPIDGEVHLSWDDDTDDGRGGTTRHLTLGRSDVLAILAAAAHAQKEEANDE